MQLFLWNNSEEVETFILD